MKKKLLFLASLAVCVVLTAADSDKTDADEKEAPALNWDAAPVDIVLQTYGEQIDRTILKDPGVPNAAITLKSREGQKLSKEEYLEAIEVVLEMNGIHLEPYKEKFIRAIPRGKARKDALEIYTDITAVPDSIPEGKVVSVMIKFRNVSYEEAQKALEGLKSEQGNFLSYERTNSILVTDTLQNIRCMCAIAREIDIASPVLENVYVRQIQNAAASDIQTHLQKIVEESMKEQEKAGKGVQNAANQNAGGLNRLGGPSRMLGSRSNAPELPKTVESLATSVSDADRGMIRGKVLIIADERSNKIIVVTSKANMDFFDKVIEQLDVETTPDVKVEVIRLKYAEADEVADMINDLIGNASSSKSDSKNSKNQNSKNGSAKVNTTTGTVTPKPSVNQRSGESKAGELSKENVTVLADKRINGLVIMARAVDFPVLHQIIDAMDVKLSQVLIETMILQVQLSDEVQTGIDWVTGLANRRKGDLIQGIGGGGDPAMSGSFANLGALDFSGKTVGEITTEAGDAAAAATGTMLITHPAAGITYFAASKALNIGAIMNATKTDSRAKLVASPIIMTVDNKEATIKATKMRYLLKGYTYSGSTYNGSAVPDYEQADIGLTVKVTPKINPNGTVMLSVEETFSAVGEPQTINAATGEGSGDGQKVGPISVETTVDRELTADITVDNRQTVILGGLSQKDTTVSENGIPILKDIPWIGRYLFGSTKESESRQELLIFLTPYVLDDSDDAVAEAVRRKSTLSDSRPWDDGGWSESELADPVSLREQLKRKQREWKNQDSEYEAELRIQKENKKRVQELKRRAEEASRQRAKEAAELADEINQAEERVAEKRVEAEVRVHEENADLIKALQEESDR